MVFNVFVVGAIICMLKDIPIATGFLILVAGFFDMLDGALARHKKKVTRFGAFLDSTLDRLSESIILLGIVGILFIAFRFTRRGQ